MHIRSKSNNGREDQRNTTGQTQQWLGNRRNGCVSQRGDCFSSIRISGVVSQVHYIVICLRRPVIPENFAFFVHRYRARVCVLTFVHRGMYCLNHRAGALWANASTLHINGRTVFSNSTADKYAGKQERVKKNYKWYVIEYWVTGWLLVPPGGYRPQLSWFYIQDGSWTTPKMFSVANVHAVLFWDRPWNVCTCVLCALYKPLPNVCFCFCLFDRYCFIFNYFRKFGLLWGILNFQQKTKQKQTLKPRVGRIRYVCQNSISIPYKRAGLFYFSVVKVLQIGVAS